MTEKCFQKNFLLVAATYGFLAVLFGAFGGHVLKPRLSADGWEIYEIASQYLMYHALALGVVAVFALHQTSSILVLSGRLIMIGTLIFSGSLFLFVLTEQKLFVHMTPIGGLGLLGGWLCLIIYAVRTCLSANHPIKG